MLQEGTGDLTEASIADETIDEWVQFAFIKTSEAFSPALSVPTRIDAVYDALAMFAKITYAASGYHMAFSPNNDKAAFAGMARLLEMPAEAAPKLLLLAGWPFRKYDHAISVSSAYLHDALPCLRLVIDFVNPWRKLRYQPALRRAGGSEPESRS